MVELDTVGFVEELAYNYNYFLIVWDKSVFGHALQDLTDGGFESILWAVCAGYCLIHMCQRKYCPKEFTRLGNKCMGNSEVLKIK